MARCTQNNLPNAPAADWPAVLAASIREPAELCRLLGLEASVAAEVSAAAEAWPMLVPRPFLARIRRGDPADPLLRQVMPQAAELVPAAGYTTDPLHEAAARCAAGMLRKYRGRLLMVASHGCGVHCRFCFRRHFLTHISDNTGENDPSVPLPAYPAVPSVTSCPTLLDKPAVPPCPTLLDKPAVPPCPTLLDKPAVPSCHTLLDKPAVAPHSIDWSAAVRTVASDRSINEIILSGGDPLTLPDMQLAELARQLAAISHLSRLRVHTRMPVVIPQRVTDELLGWLRGTRLTPIVVVHINHAAEIDPAVAAALGRLIDAGVPVLAQTVLLRGVNDTLDALAELCRRLVDLRIMPYYLHQLDAVAGAAHFAVPPKDGASLVAALRERLPGYAVPRYVREVPGAKYKTVLA